jgi:subfamily B ATP-binding cassette protein MsbA
MSQPIKRKDKDHKHFWRACRYLWPYRGMVSISVTAAFFVGLALAGSLGGMLPIIRVLIVGDTVQSWAYRQAVQHRLGVTFSQDNLQVVQLAGVTAGGAAADAGLKVGDRIDQVAAPENAPPSPFPADGFHSAEILRRLGWANGDSIDMTVDGQPVVVHPPPNHWYTFYALGAVERLPIRAVPAVAAVFGILAAISIFGQGARFFQEYLSDKAGILAVNDIRRQLYDRVLHTPLQFFGTSGTSDVTSRLVSDSAILQDGFKQVLGQTIQEPIKAAMAMGVALTLSWRLTLFIVLFAPVMALIVKKFGKKMRRASRAALQSSSSMLGQIEGTLIGIRVVKGANAERFERRRYMRVMGKLILEQMRMSKIDAFSAPVLETAIMLMAGGVVLYATHMVVLHDLSSENFIGVMACLAVIGESLRRASKAINALQKSNAAAQRIFETLDMPVERPRVGPKRSQRRLPPLQSEIEFRDVTFSYANTNSPAVNGVSLTVPKGQSVAIVGRNGSGKTTLMALLPRFFDPQSGSILVDGHNTREITLPSLRGQISIVTQDSIIFPGTIAENIAYAHPYFSQTRPCSASRKQFMSQIEESARRAFAHEFILEKPQGYETVLGEMGGQLSGGQKQRLCIARAIFRQSPILILDEATSQVDAESEHLIQQAIEQLMHERTTFVIAHRFSTIISADTIVVMERGQIVGQGKHDELLRTCETYQQLYERQLFGTAAKELAK